MAAQPTSSWPVVQGEMSQLIREHNWSATPLGAISTRPTSLKCITDLLLPCGFPMIALWGRELLQIYNDSYRDLMGKKHPGGFAQATSECWPEVWQINKPIYDKVWQGHTLTFEDALYPLTRSGKLEDCWFTLTYSPLRGEDGAIAGVLVTLYETTGRHIADQALRQNEERQTFLLKLSDGLRRTSDPIGVQRIASQMLCEHLGANRVAYAEDLGDGQTVRLAHNYVNEVPGIEGVYQYSDYASDLLREMRAGRSVVRPDIANDASLSDSEKRAHAVLQLGATLNVPLVKEDRLFAILAVHYSTSHEFPISEVELAQEVAERTWAAVERARAEEALRASEKRYRDLANALPLIIWQLDPDGLVQEVNDRWTELTGRLTSEAVGLQWLFELLPDDLRRMESAWNKANREGANYEAEFRYITGDGEVRWFFSRGVPIKTSDGTVVRWVGSDTDITELKRAEERTHFLMREVNHRSKNLLSVVQAIAKQTAAEADPVIFADRFGERLRGLARTQDILIDNEWKSVGLEQLARSQLSYFGDLFETRIHFSGPPVSVSSSAAQNLGLAFHELATNAGKYGALSADSGELFVQWRVHVVGGEQFLSLEWREMHGPPVTAPTKRGLGTLLLTRITEHAIGGKTKLTFGKEGLSWLLDAPVKNLTA